MCLVSETSTGPSKLRAQFHFPTTMLEFPSDCKHLSSVFLILASKCILQGKSYLIVPLIFISLLTICTEYFYVHISYYVYFQNGSSPLSPSSPPPLPLPNVLFFSNTVFILYLLCVLLLSCTISLCSLCC